MSNEELEQAFGPTPAAFSDRMNRTLLTLKEEEPMKKSIGRMLLLTALLALLLCGAAYAAVTQGQAWYYQNRFTAYQEYEPEKLDAIMRNLTTDIAQQDEGETPVSITVQDVSWAPERQVMTVSVCAVPKDASRFELHPQLNLDTDGAYSSEPVEDEEARAEHYLWTKNGFGPVRDMMTDRKKTLLLFHCDEVLLAGSSVRGDSSSADAFVGEDGQVIVVLEMTLDWLDEKNDAVYRGMLEAQPENRETYERILSQRQAARKAVAESGGTLTFTLPYAVETYFDNDDDAMRASVQSGAVRFTLKTAE